MMMMMMMEMLLGLQILDHKPKYCWINLKVYVITSSSGDHEWKIYIYDCCRNWSKKQECQPAVGIKWDNRES